MDTQSPSPPTPADSLALLLQLLGNGALSVLAGMVAQSLEQRLGGHRGRMESGKEETPGASIFILHFCKPDVGMLRNLT